jgi:hypothetical protein
MHRLASPLIFLVFIAPVFAQTASTRPVSDSTDPLLGKLFRSRIDGIQLNPPAGGAMIRELNSGEIVRFVYADESWDVRVKPIPLHVPLPLSAGTDGGVLELMATHLTDSNPTAEILSRQVVQMHGKDVGVIDARYTAGIDRVFAQQAIFKDTNRHYFAVQMTSKGKPKTAPANQPDPDEDRATTSFEHMLQSVRILDRQELAEEQIRRINKTHGLYVLLDRKTILAAIEPLHLMRVVRDGKDVGFIQVNEREAVHNSNDGIEVIIHSHVVVDQQPVRPETAAATPATPETGGIVISKQIGPTAVEPVKTLPPQNLYTSSIFFVTFDRSHEDWTTISQTDEQVANQLNENGYSDLTVKRILDPAEVRASVKHAATQPLSKDFADYILDVDYTRGHKREASVAAQLPPFYLPQALGQMLPRLLPSDEPAQYMFGFYVSGQRNVMSRYVDVLETKDVDLDGQTVRAVPITDRIGVDGIPTTHYCTRQGQWLGSVNDESKTVVLPTDEKTLERLWPGFSVAPEPAAQEFDADVPDKEKLDNSIGHGR